MRWHEEARLFGRLWLQEPRPGALAAARHHRALERSAPEDSDAGLTDMAVEYQRLVGFGAPPYEGVFVSPRAMLGGPSAAAVAALYEAGGWRTPGGARVAEPDHVGLELLAWSEMAPPHAGQLLCDHLALWAPVWCFAVIDLDPHPFYHTLAEATLDLVTTRIGDSTRAHVPHWSVAPPAEDELRLATVVERLLAPRWAGTYLTPPTLQRLARDLELPSAMGDRRQTLTGLFHAAGERKAVGDLLLGLDDALGRATTRYDQAAGRAPGWSAYAALWSRQVAETRRLVAGLAADARRFNASGSPTRCYLGLGSNIDAERNMPRAVELLAAVGEVVAVSTVYETAPWLDEDQPPFLNAVLALDTAADIETLARHQLPRIEAAMGRRAGDRRPGPRTIDIDLLLYGDAIDSVDHRHVPSPDILERPFVAIPLAEIAPDLRHPETGQTARQIAASFTPPPEAMSPRPDVVIAVPAAASE